MFDWLRRLIRRDTKEQVTPSGLSQPLDKISEPLNKLSEPLESFSKFPRELSRIQQRARMRELPVDKKQNLDQFFKGKVKPRGFAGQQLLKSIKEKGKIELEDTQ